MNISIFKKDGITELLTEHLLLPRKSKSKSIFENNTETKVNKKGNFNCSNKTIPSNNLVEQIDEKGSPQKMRVTVIGYSLLNGIGEKGLWKNHGVKVKSIAGGTSDT